jgi:hypothetical protein
VHVVLITKLPHQLQRDSQSWNLKTQTQHVPLNAQTQISCMQIINNPISVIKKLAWVTLILDTLNNCYNNV